MNKIITNTLLLLLLIGTGCASHLEEQFKNPPREYGPMPFWHINGELTTEGIRQQVKDASDAGFTGITLLPLAEKSPTRPGTTPQCESRCC